jgi:nicotinamidase-related amidase
MPARNPDLHGNVPDKCSVALVLIDVINDLEFPGNKKLLKQAIPMAIRLAALAERARKTGIPVIYVNDNFGKWRSDFTKQVRHCLDEKVCGKPIAEKLQPKPEDYFVLKPKHSGFFASALDILLTYLGTTTLILTGITADRCVLFTANDAFLRDYRIFVPSDCVVSIDANHNRQALRLMQRVLGVDLRPAKKLRLTELKKPTLGGAALK